MPVMGVKECLPWGYRRHWNEVWEISEQVIEGIPVFSPGNFKVDSYDSCKNYSPSPVMWVKAR